MFIAQLATLDAMAMCLMALGHWLSLYSANHNKLLWAPIVALISPWHSNQAATVYVQGIAALGILLAWRHMR